MSRTTAIHKTRIGGSKVRTGCRTCKARRVKCDEGKPHCQRCTKAGRHCEGYVSAHQQTTLPAGYKFVHYVQHGQARSISDVTSPSSSICISRSPSPLADLDLSALRSLEFYVNSTALQLGEPFGIDVFSKGLAQLMHNDAAVRHALIALAASHENLTHYGVPVFNEQRRLLALDHYNKSIQAVVHLNKSGSDRSSLITLITCLLYCAIESVQGHFSSSMKHISSGILLLAEHEDDLLLQERLGYGVNSGFIDTLRRLFVSLGGQAMEMSDVTIDEATVAYLLSSVDAPVVDYEFTTTEQAMAHVSHLTNDVIRFLVWVVDTSDDPDFPSKELVQVGDQLELRLDKWPSTYHKLRETLTKTTAPGYHPGHAALLILRINQTINRLFLGVRFSKSPLIFDDFLEDFQSIVAAAEEFFEVEARQRGSPNPAHSPHAADAAASEPIFTLALGIIPALFTTATRCRDSRTRRRALHLLKTSRRRESIWDAKIVSVVAERVVEIEEAGAMAYWRQQAGHEGTIDITKAEHIPEMARVQQMEVGFHGAEDEALVSFLDRRGSALQTHWLSWDEAHYGGRLEPTSSFHPPHDAGERLPSNR